MPHPHIPLCLTSHFMCVQKIERCARRCWSSPLNTMQLLLYTCRLHMAIDKPLKCPVVSYVPLILVYEFFPAKRANQDKFHLPYCWLYSCSCHNGKPSSISIFLGSLIPRLFHPQLLLLSMKSGRGKPGTVSLVISLNIDNTAEIAKVMMQSHNTVIRTGSYYITFLVYWSTVLVSFPGSPLVPPKNNKGVRGEPGNEANYCPELWLHLWYLGIVQTVTTRRRELHGFVDKTLSFGVLL